MLRLIVALFVLPILIIAASVEGGVAETAPTRVETRDAFIALVKDRALTRLGITLNVSPDGNITGRALGRRVSGEWSWNSGFFCRDLYFGNEALGPNCQVVEQRGSNLRFIADRGRGDYADLRLR